MDDRLGLDIVRRLRHKGLIYAMHNIHLQISQKKTEKINREMGKIKMIMHGKGIFNKFNNQSSTNLKY